MDGSGYVGLLLGLWVRLLRMELETSTGSSCFEGSISIRSPDSGI